MDDKAFVPSDEKKKLLHPDKNGENVHQINCTLR